MAVNKAPSAAQKVKDPYIQHLEVESDMRLFRFMGVFVLLGAGLISYMLTVHAVIPGVLTRRSHDIEKDQKVVIKTDDIKKEEKKKKEDEKKPPKVDKGGGGLHGRGSPKAPVTQAALKMITSRSTSSSLSSYSLLASKFNKDIDKVLGSVSGLTKTGQTRLGGRRGKSESGGFNEGLASGGSGGVDNLLGGLWGGDGSGGLNLQAKGGLKAPSASDIDLGEESGQRSTESIVSVIRQHTPSLRHTFEKYLKLQPGFKGKVTFRFTIAPSGAIIELTIVSSTTGTEEFDQEIRDKVKTWRFEPIKGKGNDVVTVPFSFSQ